MIHDQTKQNFKNALELMQRQIEELNRRDGAPSQMPSFKYNGIDLILDIEGKNFLRWSLKCSLLIFTKEELIENCIITSTRTNRAY